MSLVHKLVHRDGHATDAKTASIALVHWFMIEQNDETLGTPSPDNPDFLFKIVLLISRRMPQIWEFIRNEMASDFLGAVEEPCQEIIFWLVENDPKTTEYVLSKKSK